MDVRGNGPTNMDWFEREVKEPGWQQKWLENFTANQSMGWRMPKEDLVQDGWTALSRRIRSRIFSLPFLQMTPKNIMAAFEALDNEKMHEIRSRVDEVVDDEETAQNLKAWYRQLCKRPCFHDAYLQAYNEPSTRLVDTDGKGVERVTKKGLVVAEKEYELDCIIYASGFEVGTDQTDRNGFDVTGINGLKLSEAWADGMRSLHGIHVHGFPNMFILGGFQGAALLSNVPHNFTECGTNDRNVMIRHAMEKGFKESGGSLQKAQDAWLKLLGRGRSYSRYALRVYPWLLQQ